MKITHDSPTRFNPVRVTFEFESQEELNTMGRLFNYNPFSTVFADAMGITDDIFEDFKDAGAKLSPVHEWKDRINSACSKNHTY